MIKFSKNALIIEIKEADKSHPVAYYTNVVHYISNGEIVRIEIKYKGEWIEKVKKAWEDLK